MSRLESTSRVGRIIYHMKKKNLNRVGFLDLLHKNSKPGGKLLKNKYINKEVHNIRNLRVKWYKFESYSFNDLLIYLA